MNKFIVPISAGVSAILCAGVVTAFAATAETLPPAELAKPGRVLLLRHANAPGTGDPANFKIDDCASQRNLDSVGREQAVALGRRLAKAGITRAKVYSSQWCRCLETARLLALGPVEPLPALNSFYPTPQERDPRMAKLRAFLAALPSGGEPVILVTHQFTIAELTGAGTPSGGGSLFQLNGTGTPRHLGDISPD